MPALKRGMALGSIMSGQNSLTMSMAAISSIEWSKLMASVRRVGMPLLGVAALAVAKGIAGLLGCNFAPGCCGVGTSGRGSTGVIVGVLFGLMLGLSLGLLLGLLLSTSAVSGTAVLCKGAFNITGTDIAIWVGILRAGAMLGVAVFCVTRLLVAGLGVLAVV